MTRKIGVLVFCFMWYLTNIGTNLCNGNNQMCKDKFEAGIFTCSNMAEMNYRFLKPFKINPNEKYPLVLFLHGAGERGADNEKQLNLGVWKFACGDMQAGYPCFVIAPQCPQECKWVDVDWEADSHIMPKNPSKYMQAVLELLDTMMTQYPIDKQRIYVTGVSMGGFGTWDLIQRRPNFFAAAVPLCGGGDVNFAPDIKDVPIWAFHNKGDDSVKSKRSRDMVQAIKKSGGNPIYTEYDVNNHNCWDAAYSQQDMYKWMFAQSKTSKVLNCPIKGTFISLASDLHIGWDERDWEREFESMSKIGFDTLIIQCVSKIDSDSGQVLCFYNTNKFKMIQCHTDWIIVEAEKRGWNVFTGGIEDHVGDDANDPNFIQLNKSIADELYARFHSFKSFAGFYISTEPRLNDAGQAASAAIYSNYGNYLKTKYPDKKVAIAPFFVTDASRRCRIRNLTKSWHDRSPDEMADQTRLFLKKCPADIVVVQDSTCWDVTMADLRKYLPVIADAVRTEGREFWVDTEVFSTSDYKNYNPAPISRIAEQLEIEKNYKCIMYCFNWNMDPNGSNETKSLYRQYRDFYFPEQQ